MALDNGVDAKTPYLFQHENIDVIVFDLGNVLVRLHTAAALWPGLDPLSEASLTRQQAWGQHPAIQGYENGSIGDLDHVYEQMRRDDPELICREDFPAAFNRIIGPLFPETIDCLKRLKSHYRLILLSNTSPAHWQWVEKRDRLSRYFEQCLLSYEIHCLKPDARCYRILLDACRCPAGRVLYFDDRPENISQAEIHGIIGCQTYGGLELVNHIERMGL